MYDPQHNMDEHALHFGQSLHEEDVIGMEPEAESEAVLEPLPESGQPETKASSVHGNRYPLALRIQCLTLTSEGYRVDDIAAKLGMSRKTIYYIKKRAKDRGFDPEKDPRILERYVVDGARPGRPRKTPKPPIDGALAGPSQDVTQSLNTQVLQPQEIAMIGMEPRV